MPITSVWAWDAAYLQAVLMPYQAFVQEDGLIPALARERRALGLPAGEGRLDGVERVVLAWAAAVWWRMAPWRYDNPQWRDRVERCVTK